MMKNSTKVTKSAKMRVYLLSLLFFVAVAADDYTLDFDDDTLLRSEPELFMYDDEKNLVQIEYNQSDLTTDWEDFGGLREKDVRFFLNGRVSLIDQELFINDEETLVNSFYKPELETKFVIHGWLNSKHSDACTLVKEGFLRRGDFNVIVVDWSKITQKFPPNYFDSVGKVPKVAERVAEMINFLAMNGMNLNNVTLVGHSLGAHVAGLAANFCKGTVNYVVGLDPALPGFSYKKPGGRISTEDAKHVEIIHSNGGLLGFAKPIGKGDFFPNGGRSQPGCLEPACSHARSVNYFAESLVSEVGFYGRQCPDNVSGTCDGKLGKMGGLKRCLRDTGNYYVPTKKTKPFAIGKLFP